MTEEGVNSNLIPNKDLRPRDREVFDPEISVSDINTIEKI